MTTSAKRVPVVLAGLALASFVLGPVLLAQLGDQQSADRLGTAFFVLLVAATLGATAVVWRASRQDGTLRRGATASAVCSAVVLGAILLVYLGAVPAALELLALLLLFVTLVVHVLVATLLPVRR